MIKKIFLLLLLTSFATSFGQSARIVIQDAKGGTATITIKDVNQSNGVIHVIDHVLIPG